MAIHQIMATMLFLLAFARADHSTAQVFKGSVSCLDCKKDYDFSGIKVALKCKQAKKLSITMTQKDGSFKTALPLNILASTPSANCLASILGGPEQLYTSRKNMVTNIVKIHESYSSSYTIFHPLSFYTSCPLSHGKCGAASSAIGSSKTVDLPLPREWGLAPSSYYVPFLPIIGIP
ncbi:hypothetical protein DCAR_0311771 [Daucus carota subsp. sativus]|uniref:Uncharacterized protein n=1 Tax=Daucus carota subsp. sativus TaxID=79200 RepID=A0A166AP68_DAUCS|nr:hypothetical protein DCAR_0311771 [Daucus carota subsp. sativus]